MPRYLEVVQATTETATKILALRETGRPRSVIVTTDGGETASVSHSDRTPDVILNMPSLPPDSILTRAEADRLLAFIVHECCHVLHTSNKAWQAACQAGDRVRLWTNCLEDVRIEAKEIKAGVFPALRSVLSGMANHLHMKAVPDMAAHGVLIGARVADAPFVAAVLGRVANGYAIPAAHTLAADMAPDVAKLVNHALAGVRRCRSTDAVRLLALELIRMEQAMTKSQGSQPAPNQGQDSQDGSGGSQDSQDAQDSQDGSGGSQDAQDSQDGSGGSQDSQDAQDSQDGSGGSQDAQDGPDGSAGSQDAQHGQNGSGGSQNPGNGPPALGGDADLTDTVAKVAARAGIPDADAYRRTSHGHRLTTVRSTVDQPPYGTGAFDHAHARTLSERLPRNSVLHGQIGRLLVSEEVHRRTHHESSGRLDRRALVRMRAGAVDVFSRRDDTPGVDTALLVLIDGSSSMTEQTVGGCVRMALAQTAAWHITRAAEAANAKVAIAVFHTPLAIRLLSSNKRPAFTGAELTVVKPWSVPIADRAYGLASVQPSGWTPLSPAILAAGNILAGVPASRHILMVLTDGECDYGEAGVRAACQLVGDLGVETVGIGMNCQTVINAFPPRYSVNVRDLDQLANTGLGVLVAMLEDANPRGGGDD